jgi:hypothetical protein
MHIAFGHHTVKLRVWPSEQEMRDHVLACKSGSLILGEDSIQYHGFYSIEFHLGISGLSSFGIGLISEGHGLVPHLLLSPKKSEVLVGFNNKAICVNIIKKCIAFSIELESLFRCFVHFFDRESILIFHEFGLVSISESGHIQWSYAKDIIVGCIIEEASLKLHFLDEPSVTLNVSTGKPV